MQVIELQGTPCQRVANANPRISQIIHVASGTCTESNDLKSNFFMLLIYIYGLYYYVL